MRAAAAYVAETTEGLNLGASRRAALRLRVRGEKLSPSTRPGDKKWPLTRVRAG